MMLDPDLEALVRALESRASEWSQAAREARRKKNHEAAVEYEEQARTLRTRAAAYRTGRIEPW